MTWQIKTNWGLPQDQQRLAGFWLGCFMAEFAKPKKHSCCCFSCWVYHLGMCVVSSSFLQSLFGSLQCFVAGPPCFVVRSFGLCSQSWILMVQDCSQRWDRLILSLWLRGFANVYAIQLYVCIANEALIYVDFGMHPAGLVVSKVVTRIQETFQGASHFINWLIISLAQQITCHESHRSGRVVHVSPHGSAACWASQPSHCQIWPGYPMVNWNTEMAMESHHFQLVNL